MAELVPGAIIADRYRLDRFLGRGGMGSVWAATNALTRKRVALKFLAGDAASDPTARRRLVREARAASAIRHPNVVDVHDVLDLDGETPAIVLELLEGETLDERLDRDGKLDVDAAAAILLPVVSAVGAAHALGIVHRDLKPENVFLVAEPGGGATVKVLDFGIAKLRAVGDEPENTKLTSTGAVVGTPHYMAPEQAFGDETVDHRADAWALGIILYRCLSGVRPIDGRSSGEIFRNLATAPIPPLATVRDDVPGDISALVERMLSRAKADRPVDLREVYDVLSTHTTVSARSFGPPGETADAAPPPASKAMRRAPAPRAPESSLDAGLDELERALLEVVDASRRPREDTPTGTSATPGVASMPTLARSRLVVIGAVVLACAAVAVFVWTRSPGAPAPEPQAPTGGTPRDVSSPVPAAVPQAALVPSTAGTVGPVSSASAIDQPLPLPRPPASARPAPSGSTKPEPPPTGGTSAATSAPGIIHTPPF